MTTMTLRPGFLMRWIVPTVWFAAFATFGVQQLGGEWTGMACFVIAAIFPMVMVFYMRIEVGEEYLKIFNFIGHRTIRINDIDKAEADYNGIRFTLQNGHHARSFACARPNWALFLGKEVRADRLAVMFTDMAKKKREGGGVARESPSK